MKKVTASFMFLFMLFLAACGGSESAEEVYEKALAAGEEMESAELEMTIHQTMSNEELQEKIVMDMDMAAEMTIDPIAMYQTGTVNIEMDMEGIPEEAADEEPMEMEMYLTDEGFYMYDSTSDTWLKSNEEMLPYELMEMEQNPQDQLEMLDSFIDEVEFVEEDDSYMFRYDGEGDELLELSQEIIKENLGEETFVGMGLDLEEMLDKMTVHSIFYEIEIDKETYDTKSVVMNMDLDIEEAGETVRMKQEMSGSYTGVNTIDSIEVPQEVIDSAVEIY